MEEGGGGGRWLNEETLKVLRRSLWKKDLQVALVHKARTINHSKKLFLCLGPLSSITGWKIYLFLNVHTPPLNCLCYNEPNLHLECIASCLWIKTRMKNSLAA